jgi:capsular exopolysaccharide synthesis family protein
LTLVLLRAFTDRRIWTVEEVPQLLGASVVGVIPQLASGKRAKIGRVIETDPGSAAAEAIRAVRTATAFALPRNGRGVVVVTSAVAREGKSITASNLAISLAQAGRKTILVDADLRAPGLAEIYGTEGALGLGEVLQGKYELPRVIQPGVAPMLDLLAAGDSAGRSAELLESAECRSLIERLRGDYECVVLDSSPVLDTSESRTLASFADLTIFVMRMDLSTAPNSKRAMGMLHSVRARVLGVVLNGAKRGSGKSYAGGINYGGYGNAYGDRSSQPVETPGEKVRVASSGS